MQRDMDLVRKILFYVEEKYVAGGPEIPVCIDGYSDNVRRMSGILRLSE